MIVTRILELQATEWINLHDID